MDKTTEFSTFEDAENAIKEQVIALCDTYANTIEATLVVLKKGIDKPGITSDDRHLFKAMHFEGQDHLHNLQQLQEELTKKTQSDRHLLLEVSAEVLSNAIKFLHGVPKKIETTHIHGLSTDTES